MEYKLKISSGLNDSKGVALDDYLPKDYFPDGFIPRVGDMIILNNLYWDVDQIIIDNAHSEIRIWVKPNVMR